jgi:phosphoglycolate phosphatase
MPGVRHASGFPALVLFDLDGTLSTVPRTSWRRSTACVRRARRPPITLAQLRPHVSRGARAMLATAFTRLDADARESMIGEFLDIYREELSRTRASRSTASKALLQPSRPPAAAGESSPNKPDPWRGSCFHCSDGSSAARSGRWRHATSAQNPDPEPLLHAARQVGIDADRCVYVGDDERDIVAARAAGMPSVAALWGYRSTRRSGGRGRRTSPSMRPRRCCMRMHGPRAAMSDSQALAAFLDKWRERWPEWSVAEAFITRYAIGTWPSHEFALLQELTDAAWARSDPRPVRGENSAGGRKNCTARPPASSTPPVGSCVANPRCSVESIRRGAFRPCWGGP